MSGSSADRDGTLARTSSGPGPGHRALDVLVGRWRTTGEFVGAAEDAPCLRASDSYEWLPGGYFLLHRAEGELDGTRFATHEIFGYDAAEEHHFSYSFDDRGTVSRYHASFEGRAWRIDGVAERFRGEFGADGRTLAGLWEQRTDAGWRPWLRIALTRES